MGKGGSDDELTSASREGNKPAASHDQTREACPDDRAGHGNSGDIYRPGVAIWREDIGNEDVPKVVGCGHIGNRRIINDEADRAAETSWPVPAAGTINPETEIPCAVAVQGPGGCGQGWVMCSDHNIGQRNAGAVELEDLKVRRPGLRVRI